MSNVKTEKRHATIETDRVGILIDFFRWLPQYFFPKTCVGCGREGWWVCPACRPTAPQVFDHPICPECARPSALGAHPGCRRPYGLDGLTSFYRYDGWAKLLMRAAKFQSPPQRKPLQALSHEFAPLLSSRLHQALGTRYQEPMVMVPLPLHWWRERKRSYNQATLIAQSLSAALKLPLDDAIVQRTTYTRPQTLLAPRKGISPTASLSRRIKAQARERRKNVRGAFTIRNKAVIPASLLLVDDVWTSGATMRECCRVLKRSGAQWVWGVTLFRA